MEQLTAKQTAKQLVLNLQDAGITNEYVNLILKTIKEEKKESFYDGWNAGKEAARFAFNELVNEGDNYNGQFLKNWLKNTKL
jgi:hypothetical protein